MPFARALPIFSPHAFSSVHVHVRPPKAPAMSPGPSGTVCRARHCLSHSVHRAMIMPTPQFPSLIVTKQSFLQTSMHAR